MSLLPHYYLNLSALLNAPVGFSCPTAQCLLGRFKEVALRNLLTRCHLQLVGHENGLVPVWGKSPLHLLGHVLLLLNSLDAKRSLIFICVHPLGQGLVIKGELLWIESLRVMSHSERSPIHKTVTASRDTAPGVVDMPPTLLHLLLLQPVKAVCTPKIIVL